MAEPRVSCRIELGGWFDVNWADYAGDMVVHEQVKQGTMRSTTLVGHPRDMEAFLGTLHMLVDRGIPVVVVEYRQVTPREAVDGDSSLNDSAHVTLQPCAG